MKLLTILLLLFTTITYSQLEPLPTDSVDVQLGRYNVRMTFDDAYNIIDTYPDLKLYERRMYITEEIIGLEIHESDVFIEPIDLYDY